MKSIIRLILYAYRTVFCDIEHALFDIRYPRPEADLYLTDLEYEGVGCGKFVHKIMGDARSRFSEILLSQARELRRILEKAFLGLMATKTDPMVFTKLLERRAELFGMMVPSQDEKMSSEDAFLRDYLIFAAKYREWLAGCTIDYTVYQKYIYRRILADVESYPDVMAPLVEFTEREKPVLEEIFQEVIEACKQRRPVDLVAAGILTEEDADSPRSSSKSPPTTADVVYTAYSLTHWLVKFLIVIRQLQEGMLVFIIRNALADSTLQVPRRRGEASLSLKLLLLTGITVNVDVTSVLKACREDFADLNYKALYVILTKGTPDISFVTFLEESQNIVEDRLSYFNRFSELRPLLVQSERPPKKSKWCTCFETKQRTSLGRHKFKSPVKRQESRPDQVPRGFYAVARYSIDTISSQQDVLDVGEKPDVLLLGDEGPAPAEDGNLDVKVTSSRQSPEQKDLVVSTGHEELSAGRVRRRRQRGCSIL